MKEFWKWMVTNKHIGFTSGKLKSLEGRELEGGATKQMMIGYMIEYLIENKKFDDFTDDKFLVCQYDILGIDDFYNDLKQQIEAIK